MTYPSPSDLFLRQADELVLLWVGLEEPVYMDALLELFCERLGQVTPDWQRPALLGKSPRHEVKMALEMARKAAEVVKEDAA